MEPVFHLSARLFGLVPTPQDIGLGLSKATFPGAAGQDFHGRGATVLDPEEKARIHRGEHFGGSERRQKDNVDMA